MTTKLYQVEQSEHGHDRTVLTGAAAFDVAQVRMMAITENMLANNWWRTDKRQSKKVTSCVILTNGTRVVVLSVVESGTETRLALNETEWLTLVSQAERLEAIERDFDTLLTGDQTPADGIYDCRDGQDEYQESAGV